MVREQLKELSKVVLKKKTIKECKEFKEYFEPAYIIEGCIGAPFIAESTSGDIYEDYDLFSQCECCGDYSFSLIADLETIEELIDYYRNDRDDYDYDSEEDDEEDDVDDDTYECAAIDIFDTSKTFNWIDLYSEYFSGLFTEDEQIILDLAIKRFDDVYGSDDNIAEVESVMSDLSDKIGVVVLDFVKKFNKYSCE